MVSNVEALLGGISSPSISLGPNEQLQFCVHVQNTCFAMYILYLYSYCIFYDTVADLIFHMQSENSSYKKKVKKKKKTS